MIWLALDTATDRAMVAAERNGAVYRAALHGARQHARAFPALIGDVLGAAGGSLADVGGLVVADGPGSFTGLRVGAAVAKAIARTVRVPLRTAPSLLARAAGAAPHDGRLVVAIADALRGEVYAAAYRFDGTAVHTVVSPTVLRPHEVRGRCGEPDLLVAGAGPEAIAAVVGGAPTPVVTGDAALPDAGTLLLLRTLEGGTVVVDDVAGWEPVYGRPAEAQARWEETHGRPLPHPAGPHR